MKQMTEAECEALLGPEMVAFIHTLPASELEAMAHEDPVALQRISWSSQRWRNGRA
jgi:hypothetical protein